MRHSIIARRAAFAWLAVAIAGIGAPPTAQRAATVADSVRVRTFLPERAVTISPDGKRIAYVVIEPNLETNRTETALYVRELPESVANDAQPRQDKALLRSVGMSQMQWVAEGRALLVLHRPDDKPGVVARVDVASGECKSVSPRDVDIESFAATPDGRRLAMIASMPDVPQADRFDSPRGVIIMEEDFLLDIDARAAAAKKPSLDAVIVADVAGGGHSTLFAGKRGVDLMSPAIAPNGRYVTFLALGEALAYPKSWQKDAAFRQWPERGFVVPQTEMLLADVPEQLPKISPTPAGAESNKSHLRPALDAGCIADYAWQLPAMWSDDSASYLVCGPSPVGDRGTIDEPLEGPYRPQRLWAINVRTGAAERVHDATPQQILSFDSATHRATVVTRKGLVASIRRSEGNAGTWSVQQRTKLPASDASNVTISPVDANRSIGIRQSITMSPDLWLFDARSAKPLQLTEINPELREQTLGRVEPVQWVGANDADVTGYLIYPVGYTVTKETSRTRYPAVILCKSWDDTFIHGGNGGFIANFAPQALANCGFVVLMLKDSIGPYPKGTWKSLPGGISEAFRAMDAYETAKRELVARGLVDADRVGLMGFSRSSWTVDFTITHSAERWAAAVSADSGIYNYGTYLGNKNLRSGMAAMYGGPPSGKTWQAWLDYAPPFSASRVRTPLLMQYHGKVSMAAEFYSALVTQGKPVELVLFPGGKHILERPLERLGSMQGSVDWFRYWLADYENPAPQYPDQTTRWRKLRVQHERNEKLIAEGKDSAAVFAKQPRGQAE